MNRKNLRPYFSEFLGTALLIVIGDGVVAQTILSNEHFGTWLSINLGWASAVSLSGFLSDPSPTINPAVSIALAVVRPSKAQWRALPGKLVAQFLGAFVGAALVYLNYRSAIAEWDPEYSVPRGNILSPKGHESAGIFSTYPSALLGGVWEGFFQELLGSAVLQFGLLGIAHANNPQRFSGVHMSVFLLLLAVGVALGWQTGYAVNPARDFGPRLFSAFIYGREVFTAANYYFWVPIVAPVVGCLIGAVTYDAMLYEGEGSIVTDAMDKMEGGDGRLRLD